MMNPLKIQQDYAMDHCLHKIETRKHRYRQIKDNKTHSGNVGAFLNWLHPTKIPNGICFLNDLYQNALKLRKMHLLWPAKVQHEGQAQEKNK